MDSVEEEINQIVLRKFNSSSSDLYLFDLDIGAEGALAHRLQHNTRIVTFRLDSYLEMKELNILGMH
jgi:hypothetical protein